MSVRIAMVALTLLMFAGYRQVKSQTNNSYNGLDLVDKAGNIRKPSDYRDRYQALGTYAVVDLNCGTDMHYTYESPGTGDDYRKTGKFAYGTVLVKQIFATDHAHLTDG